jgi:hypothetical protein
MSVPIPWVEDCRRNPQLLTLLHPKVGGVDTAGHGPTSADEFLVSFYFNDQGEEQTERRFLGPGAGVLEESLVKVSLEEQESRKPALD